MRPRAWLAAIGLPLFVAPVLVVACRLTDGLTGGAPLDDGGDDVGAACDADLARSPESCGACGNACAAGPNAFAACVDGGCVIACVAGFGDCDDAGANGCEVNVNVSRANCGRCGHDCFGGACTGGACQPVTLATGVNTPVQLASDDTYLYGINAYGTVTRISKTGGALTALAAGDETAQSPPPRITLADGVLYFTSLGTSADGGAQGGRDGGVWQLSLDGGGAKLLVGGGAPYAVSTSPVHLYWTDGDPNGSAPTASVRRCKLGGCASSVETLVPATAGRLTDILVSGPNVFWTNAGTAPAYAESAVNKCATASCSPVPLATSPPEPFALAADKSAVYWTASSGVLASCLVAGCSNQPASVDTFQFGPRFLAISGLSLFWTNADGTIKSVAKAGPASTERTLFVNRGSSPWDIVVDPDAIYWTDYAGSSDATLFKLAR